MNKEKQERRSKRRAALAATLVLVLIFAAIGGIYYRKYMLKSSSAVSVADNYKTSTVQRGTVAVSISESGSVTAGSQSQVLSLADAADSLSSKDEEESTVDTSEGTDTTEETDSERNISEAVEIEEDVKTQSAEDMSGMMNSQGGGGMSSGSQGGGSSAEGTSASSSSSEDDSEMSLEVEEVLVKVGQNIEEGDPIMTITQDSIDSYIEALEEEIASCSLTVTQEEINVETKQAEADYTYNMYLAQGATAQETYDATIASLAKAVEDAQEAVDEAREDVDTYQYYVDLGYSSYEDELEEALETLEDADDQLTIAANSEITGAIEAKQTLESALTNYQYADQLYQIDTDGLEDDLNDAKEALADAQEALEVFKAYLGDGTIYSEYTGMVMSLGYEAGDTLTDESEIMTCSDAENVSMTVSVTQDDVSNISIGDAAQITLDAYEDEVFTGEVTAIETSTSMGSSTVTYNVTVTFTGDISKIYNGMTGEADFSVQSEEDVLYVPNKAVYQDGTRTYVKILEDNGTVTQTDVTTGFSNGKHVVVLTGLEEGQIVIIESGLDA